MRARVCVANANSPRVRVFSPPLRLGILSSVRARLRQIGDYAASISPIFSSDDNVEINNVEA